MYKFLPFVKRYKTILLSPFISIFFSAIPHIASAALGVEDTLDVIFWGFIVGIPVVFEKLWSIFASVSNQLFNLVISKLVVNSDHNWSITTQQIFVSGWVTTRNLANMLIVLAIIGIALATILKFREYEAKKLLFPMLLIALLINFSNVLVGGMIDISNITMAELGKNSGGEAKTIINTIDKFEGQIIKAVMSEHYIETSAATGNFTSRLTDGGVLMQIGIIYFIVGLIFVYLSLLLVGRYALLGILFILAPLAFLFRVFPFPDTKKLWSEWWGKFIKWCFIGVGLSFFLYLSNEMLSYVIANYPPGTDTKQMGNVIFDVGIVIMVLLVGIKVSTKSAQGLASAVFGAGAAIAMGAAGFAGNLLRPKRLENWAKDKATSIGERLGVVDENTTRVNQQKRLQKEKAKLATSTPEELAKISNEKTGYTESSRVRKAAATAMLIDKGKGSMIDADKKEEAAAHAVKYGVQKSAITDKHPELLTVTDKEAKEQLIDKRRAEIEETLVSIGRTPQQAYIEAHRRVGSYNPTAFEVKTEKEAMHQEKIRERTLGYAPITDKEAEEKVINDKVDKTLLTATTRGGKKMTGREALKYDYIHGAKYTPEQADVALREDIDKMRKEEKEKNPPSAPEILRAKNELLKERGTPEAAAENESNRQRVKALHPEMSEEEITKKIKHDEYPKYNPDFKGKKIEEVAKIAMEEPQSSRSTKALEHIIKEKRIDLIQDPSGRNQDQYVIQRLKTAQKEFGSTTVNDAKRIKAEYAVADTQAVERAMALDTSSLSPDQKRKKAEEELERRAGPGVDNTNMPKSASEQVEKIANELLVDPKDSSKGMKTDSMGNTIKLGSEFAGMVENLAKNSDDLEKLTIALGGLKEVGEQMEHLGKRFDSDALTRAVKIDPRYKEYDTPAVNERANKIEAASVAKGVPLPRNIAKKRAGEELVGEGFAKADINSLSEEALGQGDLVINTKLKGLSKKLERMVPSQINAINKAVEAGSPQRTKINAEIARLKTTGMPKDKERAKEIEAIIVEIQTA